jgi:RepB DNA-primase from phage plasmid
MLQSQRLTTLSHCLLTDRDYCGARQRRAIYTREKHGGGMVEDSTEHNALSRRGAEGAETEARAMLEAFASVGATRFDVTWTNSAGDKQRFRGGRSLADLARTLPAMLDAATAQQHNVIVRPHGPGVSFIQLDDLAADKLGRLAPAVFLIIETSPGNFQAWLALAGDEDKELARRVRRGTGADATASGATRIAGSYNFKTKYAPAFPRVAIREARAGHMTTAAELDELGVAAAPEVFAPLPGGRPALAKPRAGGRWPSYALCLDGAPLNSEGTGPDTSRADFVWCMTAITWGRSIDETAERLIEESAKAKANGTGYADLTARNAALAVERRRRTPRSWRGEEHGRG